MSKPQDNKGIFSVRLNTKMVKPLKHLAIDLNKSVGELVEEAIQELLKKYECKKQPHERKTK